MTDITSMPVKTMYDTVVRDIRRISITSISVALFRLEEFNHLMALSHLMFHAVLSYFNNVCKIFNRRPPVALRHGYSGFAFPGDPALFSKLRQNPMKKVMAG
jgi:hypothetical protein